MKSREEKSGREKEKESEEDTMARNVRKVAKH